MESSTALREEIRELGRSIASVAAAFESVRSPLAAAVGRSQELNDKLSRYLREWCGTSDEFKRLVLSSTGTAADGVRTANDFINNIQHTLLNDGVSRDSKRLLVQGFINTLDGKVQSARDMSQGFIDLKRKVERHMGEFRDMLSGYHIPHMEERARQLGEDIGHLVVLVENLVNQISSLDTKVDAAIASTATTGVLGFLFPVFWVVTLPSAGMIAAMNDELRSCRNRRDNARRDIENKQREREILSGDTAVIKEVKEATERRVPDVERIVSKVGAFGRVWAVIRADAQAIMGKLEYAHNTETTTLFKERVKSSERLYAVLRDDLDAYAQLRMP